VLLSGRLFSGPPGAPTLEGQHVLQDFVLVGAAFVLAATLGGSRLTRRPDELDARVTVVARASSS